MKIWKILSYKERLNTHNPELKPFTVEKLVNRIEKSELDLNNGNIKNQEDLERISTNWQQLK